MLSRIRVDTIKPYGYQFLGLVLPQFVAIGVTSVIVKNAGIEVFGQYSLMLGVLALAFGVMGSALDTGFQRTCDPVRLNIVLVAKLAVWIVVMPCIIMVAWLMNLGWFAMMCLAIGFIFQQSMATLVVKHRITGQDSKSVAPRLVPVLVFFAAIYVVGPDNTDTIALLYAISWIIYSLPMLSLTLWKTSVDLRSSVYVIKSAWPIWISLLMTQAYGNVDLFLLSYFHSHDVVGVYKIAYTFGSMTVPIAGVFSFIFLTKISAAVKTNNHSLTLIVLKQQFTIVGVLGVGLLLFMLFFFPYLAKLLYGSVSNATTSSAVIIAVAMVFNMLTMVYSYTLLAFHREKVIAKLTIAGVAIYISISILLVPFYADKGAALAMVAAYVALFLMYRRAHLKQMKIAFSRLGTVCITPSNHPGI
jgi:O-antigen/teichoic acid export membrane protein